MNTRIKLTRNTINSRAEAEKALRTIRELTIDKNLRMLGQEQAVKAVQESHREPLAKIDAELQQQTELLSHWAESHKDEFGKHKSIEMTHGTIGWRTGMPKLVKTVKDRWDQMVDRVKQCLGSVYIRTKEEIDKEMIISDASNFTIRTDELLAAKLKVVQEEVFFVSPNIDEVDNKQTAIG